MGKVVEELEPYHCCIWFNPDLDPQSKKSEQDKPRVLVDKFIVLASIRERAIALAATFIPKEFQDRMSEVVVDATSFYKSPR